MIRNVVLRGFTADNAWPQKSEVNSSGHGSSMCDKIRERERIQTHGHGSLVLVSFSGIAYEICPYVLITNLIILMTLCCDVVWCGVPHQYHPMSQKMPCIIFSASNSMDSKLIGILQIGWEDPTIPISSRLFLIVYWLFQWIGLRETLDRKPIECPRF